MIKLKQVEEQAGKKRCRKFRVSKRQEKRMEEGARGWRGQGINLNNMEGIANFIIPMLKNQTVNTNPHLFQLTKFQTLKHEPLFQLSFEPTNKNHPTSSQAPRFNSDHLHFTPAFLLPCDQKFCRENVSFERLKFEEKIQNAQEKSIIVGTTHSPQNPLKVSPPSNFCQVCKTHYPDYEAHIDLPAHQLLQSSSPANDHIHELSQAFASKLGRRKPIAKGRTRRTKTESNLDRQLLGVGLRRRQSWRVTSSVKSSVVSTKLSEELC